MTANEPEMKNTSRYSISDARSHGRSGSGAPWGNAGVPVISPPPVFGMQTQYEFGGAAAQITASNPPTGTQTSGDGRWETEWKESTFMWTGFIPLFEIPNRPKVPQGVLFIRPLSFFHSTRPARMASVTLWPLGASHRKFVVIWTVFRSCWLSQVSDVRGNISWGGCPAWRETLLLQDVQHRQQRITRRGTQRDATIPSSIVENKIYVTNWDIEFHDLLKLLSGYVMEIQYQ